MAVHIKLALILMYWVSVQEGFEQCKRLAVTLCKASHSCAISNCESGHMRQSFGAGVTVETSLAYPGPPITHTYFSTLSFSLLFSCDHTNDKNIAPNPTLNPTIPIPALSP